mgnify:CR=1 FL=1
MKYDLIVTLDGTLCGVLPCGHAAKDLGVGNVCSMMTSPLIHTQTVLLHEYLRDHVWKSFSSLRKMMQC